MATTYPRKSFKTAIEYAEAVDKLGGKSTMEILSESLGKKISGSFRDCISSALKHGLILKDGDNFKISPLYTDIKLSYTEEEKNDFLRKAFLLPKEYQEILKRFNGKELPMTVLDKMLIREYDVSSTISKSVANNILKGATDVGLIISGKVSLDENEVETTETIESLEHNIEPKTEVVIKESQPKPVKKAKAKVEVEEPTTKDKIRTQIKSNLDGSNKEISININIQLTVPETTNEEVYDKFFAAMKKHLLS